MEQILDSLKKIIYRWVNTEVPITQDISQGDNILKIDSTRRFYPGDVVAITDGVEYEFPVNIKYILDLNTVELESPTNFNWSKSNAYLKKSINGQFVQGIYIGDVSTVIKFPAIVINGKSKTSEWTTLESTTEKYEVSISCYVEQATQEDGYRTLLKMTKIVEQGLKRNMFPVITSSPSVEILDSIFTGDEFIKVESTDGLIQDQLLVIEGKYNAEDIAIREVIDDQTLKITSVFNNYELLDNPKIIRIDRFLYRTWPNSIDYTVIQKDSLLKGSTISWSGEEIETQGHIGWLDTPRE